MTTPAAAAFYLEQHQTMLGERKNAVFNPHGKSIDELPIIWGFNNGGSNDWWEGVLLSSDGECLGGHICSHEGYMRHDLGILEGTRNDRHVEQFQKHYPDGYRMEFVGHEDAKTHPGLQAAIAAYKVKHPEPKQD